MDSSENNNNNIVSDTMQRGEEDFRRTAFEYSFPTNDDDDTESNKSTPYYTPMDFIQSPFEFPTPRLMDADKISGSSASTIATTAVSTVAIAKCPYIAQAANIEIENMSIAKQRKELDIEKHSSRVIQTSSKSLIKHLEPSSPNVQRKFRRFSLYERRSCSPQHLILKNSSSVECTVDIDKENTKPLFNTDKNDEANSGNDSPNLILDETGSPRILTSSEAAMLSSGRLTFSPKLLTSINNLHLTSPLGVISSAGYKNGNYFKFPEIDHVVRDDRSMQQAASIIADSNAASHKDNQTKNVSSSLSETEKTEAEPKAISNMDLSTTSATSAIQPKTETKRNRKNKNNLTIKIMSNASSSSKVVHPQHFCNNIISQSKLPSSPSSNKPKTPTIKSTKEKALSLDSAPQAKDCLKDLLLQPQINLSCDEIDSSSQDTVKSFQYQDRLKIKAPNSKSTSLSQLTVHNSSAVSKFNKAGIRRRIPNSSSIDWQLHQRKHASFNIPDITKKVCESSDDKPVLVLKEDKVLGDTQTSLSSLPAPTSANCASTPSTTHRAPFKHNPLLHNSNTNLKTLPEFLTLVEFSTPSGGNADPPFKQKSMDLPSSTTPSSSSQVKSVGSSPSTNLLQRRGSNHSLTLNLHGSCSNLLGSCRSGLSVSNYSLGSVGNSSNNLNSKSSCNLNISASQNSQAPNASAINSSQGAKQSLFRRRGSNQSLTLTNLAATSCGNLNSFPSQSSLNVERPQLASLSRPIMNSSVGTTPRRGLLERRGSNQSLTLNMSSSFGGIGSEKGLLGFSNMNLGDSKQGEEIKPSHQPLVANCSVHSHQRRFFSSEGLNRNNAHFSDLDQDHKRNVNQVCFGSVTNLKPNERDSSDKISTGRGNNMHAEHFDFHESAICTCSGVRNIMTKPLSPQTTSEEFKIYLANIQMLQNASNALNQNDLIKLNYIFDNSYTTNSKSITEQSIHILSMPASNKEAETPPALISNSEDCEISERYLFVVKEVLQSLQLDDEEQKRVFRSLHKEFWDLPLNHQEKPMVFGSQTKNRYKTILPNENSRVLLEKESKQLIEMIQSYAGIEDDFVSELTNQIPTSDEVPYINANYIKGPDYTSKCYIATQGPLPNTIYEFWLMIYQNTRKYIEISKGPESPICREGKSLHQYYQKIVMLTNFMENNRQKCSIYFPVDLNEIFISTARDEVVQPTAMFGDFINTILNSSFQNNLAKSNAKRPKEPIQVITMDTIKAKVGTELENQLPHNSSFFVIKNIGIVRKNGFSIRKLIILYCTKFVECVNYLYINKFFCYHYWYPDWPDHRSPRDINTLLDISLHVMNLGKCESEFEVFDDGESTPPTHINSQSIELYQQDIFNAVQPLPVVHCSAGIGRTGCMTAILNGIRQVRQSLAYSLTSMATNAAREASTLQALSPVDFRLPKQFVEEESTLTHPLPTDIDCSFTRNTLVYIRYILKMEQKLKETTSPAPAPAADIDRMKNYVGPSWVLPSLAELPKMSNIFVDILGIVCNLRLQRGGMVQNSEQYELIHRAICLYLKRTFALKRF